MKTILLCLLTVLGGTNVQASDDEQKNTHEQVMFYGQLLAAAAVGAATVSAKHYIASIPDKSQEMLLNAAATHKLRRAEWLLWLGVDPNTKKNDQGFALHNAVYHDNQAMVHLLRTYGAEEQFYDDTFYDMRLALHHTTRVPGWYTLHIDEPNFFYPCNVPEKTHYSPSMLHLLLTLYKEKKLPQKHPAYQVYQWALAKKLDEKAAKDKELSPEALALQEVPLFLHIAKKNWAYELQYADPRTYR